MAAFFDLSRVFERRNGAAAPAQAGTLAAFAADAPAEGGPPQPEAPPAWATAAAPLPAAELPAAVEPVPAVDPAEARVARTLRSALDCLTGNVMVADADGIIIFANPAVLSMLQQAEMDLRKDLPDFRANRVVGEHFDVFHRQRQRQRNLLGALTTTYRTNITVGGRRFSLTATPVFESDGTRLGTVVEWQDLQFEQLFESTVDAAIQQAIQGNLTVRVDTRDKSGLIARVAGNINQLFELFESVLRDVSGSVTALASGDLSRRMETRYAGSYGELQQSVNATIDTLAGVVAGIAEASAQVHANAAEIASGNADLNQRTEQQAASLEETSAVMDELSSTVQNNAANSAQAMTLAGEAHTVAGKGRSVVEDTLAAMEEITHSSKRIAEISSVIDQIAFQTNILALNAAVEAARAGDQGKGFAVVAGEVRNLAGRCAKAAREIGELIKDSVAKIERGSTLAQRSAGTFGEIVEAVTKVHAITSEIGLASGEQSRGIDEVTRTITQLDEMTQQNAALVEEAAAASEMLDRQAANLRELLAFFRSR